MPSGGLHLTAYDPGWPKRFEAERKVLQEAPSSWLVGPIEHVGSTAVPGLVAKPTIDIMAAVSELDASRAAFDALHGLGYLYFPHRADQMHWFCKPSPALRTHHLHLVPYRSRLWRARLSFREALRRDPGLAERYAALKLELLRRFPDDREAYTEAKGPFIRQVLATVRGERSER